MYCEIISSYHQKNPGQSWRNSAQREKEYPRRRGYVWNEIATRLGYHGSAHDNLRSIIQKEIKKHEKDRIKRFTEGRYKKVLFARLEKGQESIVEYFSQDCNPDYGTGCIQTFFDCRNQRATI